MHALEDNAYNMASSVIRGRCVCVTNFGWRMRLVDTEGSGKKLGKRADKQHGDGKRFDHASEQ